MFIGGSQDEIHKGIIGGIIAVVVLVLVFSSFTTVQSGNRGVLLQLGAVKPTILTEGFILKFRFSRMSSRLKFGSKKRKVPRRQLQRIFKWSQPKLQSTIRLIQMLSINFIKKSVWIIAPELWIQRLPKSLKAITAQYTAEELISKRPEVSAQVKDMLSKKLSKYYMKLEDINIKEFAFSEEFNKAIESKQTAEQNALKAQRDLDRIKIEAQQQVAQAGAEAEALRLKKQEVTPELIQLKQIEVQEKALEKWDGQLPSVTGGATPFIDVNGLTGNK